MNKKLIDSNIICEKTNNIFSYKCISYTYSNENKLCFSIKLKVKFLCFWITVWEGNFYDNEDYLRNIDYDYEYNYQLNNALDILHTLEV